MSKYKERGRYHFDEFEKDTPYRHHMLDVVDKVKKHLDKSDCILDVGCGEGLLVHLLELEGFDVFGVDADQEAVDLGDPDSIAHEKFDGQHSGYDAILFMDSLEHVADWRKVLKGSIECGAKKMFIAVPDRHDKHAITQDMGNKVQDFMGAYHDWSQVHYERRHARDFYIFQRET